MKNILQRIIKGPTRIYLSRIKRFLWSRFNIKKLCIDRRRYRENWNSYEALNTRENFKLYTNNKYAILGEWDEQAGNLGGYFWQDLWAARHIYLDNPETHYDIGSRIDGFIGHLCSFRKKVVLIDVRPFEKNVDGVEFLQADAKDLQIIPSNSIQSLSSLCAIEHFGLGRYGDEIDPEGCFKALKEMERVIAQNGYLYLSVPIGRECVQFNAHRIFYPETIIRELSNMQLEEFSTIAPEPDEIVYHDDIKRYNNISTGGHVFGLFKFKKIL